MRNLGLIVAFWLVAVLPTGSLALGLGEIEVSSFLNQPLKAKIEVISARPGEIDDLLVSLASNEAFTRAGLSRPRHLTDLRFSVNKSEEGDSAVILVTTKDSVKEPFLNFLIEADWAKGRILREFTVLLDPPFYAEQPAPTETMTQDSMPASDDSGDMAEPESEPEATSSDAAERAVASSETITEPIALSESTSSESRSGGQTSSPPASSEYVADESQNIIEGDVLVVKGDTLWSIASRYKDKDHSMAQVMLAFQRTNPNAFGDGNINYLKAGAVLRAPSADEMDALDQQAAYAEMLTQNGLWDDYVARVTGVSPATGGGVDDGTGQSAEESQGELSLLMPAGDGSDSTGTGDSAGMDQLRTRLALAEEELEASRIENADLESRISELQARVSKFEELQKMIEIEDDSLAQIQAGQTGDLAQSMADGESEEDLGDDSVSAQPQDAASISDTLKADEDALLEELLAEEAAAQAEEQAALQAGDMPDGESETTVSDELIEEPTLATADSADQMADDETESTATVVPPAPVIITESASASDSMLDGILPASVTNMVTDITSSMGGIFGDPIILAAIGGVIVLLLILVIVMRRKAAQGGDSDIASAGDDNLFANDDEDDFTPVHLTDMDEPVVTDIGAPSGVPNGQALEGGFSEPEIVSAVDTPEPQMEASTPAVAEQDDVANEVDVYLAYGLYDNAEDLLKASLAENPDRVDYRSKLLDTYFATKNVNAFVEEAQNLKAMGDAAIGYWDRVQIMGYELAPDNALFSDAKDSGLSAADLEIAKPQEADFDLGGSDEDTADFSSTDFNLGEEAGADDFSDTMLSDEVGDLESTQKLAPVDDTSLNDVEAGFDDEGDLLELPDDLGDELEFSMDDGGGLDFDMDEGLDDDLDLGDALEPDSADDEALELDMPQDEDIDFGKTEVITPNYEETAVIPRPVESDAEDAVEDTAMNDFDQFAEETGDLVLDGGDAGDDSEDISMMDFGSEDFVEATELAQSVGDDDFLLDDEEDEDISTDTFAPGDFDEPTAVVESMDDVDDMDDLMLPDDVDEVSTKLDLARAFIDMGDTEGARGSLEEVMSEGNAEQKAEAKSLLDQI